MALQNLLGDIALDSTLQDVLTALAGIQPRGDNDAVFAQTPNNGMLIGTAREKFRDEFLTLSTDNWTVVNNAPGMTVDCQGDTGGARFLNINSGTTNGDDYYLLSKATFSMPFKLVIGLSMSQRIAGTVFEAGFVEVDDNGNIVTETSVFSGPNCLDARNAAIMSFQGTSTTNGYYTIRAQGVSELFSAATSYGTTHMSATGTTPNFVAKNQFEIMATTELLTIQSRAINATSAGTSVVNRTDYCPNPDRKYAILIRCRNTSTPASATDCRVHFVRVVDASSVSINFGIIAGNPTDVAAAPVKIINSATLSVSNSTVYPVIAAAATSGIALTAHKLISAATTNATSVKTSAGRIASGLIINNSASWRYLKLYNKASAPNVGTDTPIFTIGLKPGDVADLTNLTNVFGISFATGIAYAITGAPADSDTTAIGASEVVVALQYI